MFTTPIPEPSAVSVNVTETVTLNTGQKGTITFTPEAITSRFQVAMVAVSRYPDSTYEVRFDGTTGYGDQNVGSARPPTDVDDQGVTFVPCQNFEQRMEVIIRYTGSSERTFAAQVIGWEEV